MTTEHFNIRIVTEPCPACKNVSVGLIVEVIQSDRGQWWICSHCNTAKRIHPTKPRQIRLRKASGPREAERIVSEYIRANPNGELTGMAVFRWYEKENGRYFNSRADKNRIYHAINRVRDKSLKVS